MVVAIIIPTYNRKEYLQMLLEQLRKQTNSLHAELIPVVVIDGSTDGTLELLPDQYPEAKILQGPGNWWWTRSINEGSTYAISQFKPDYLLLLNDDSQIFPNYSDELLKTIDPQVSTAIIASISVTDTQPERISFSGIRSINWLKFKKYNYYPAFTLSNSVPTKQVLPTYALNGRGTLIPTHVFQKLGMLDQQHFPQYGSDDDLALRAWKNGFQVLINFEAKVIDRTMETSKGAAFRNDSLILFLKSFFTWNSVNYLPKQLFFFYRHGYKFLMPFYFVKYLLGTSYAYFFKYKKLRREL